LRRRLSPGLPLSLSTAPAGDLAVRDLELLDEKGDCCDTDTASTLDDR